LFPGIPHVSKYVRYNARLVQEICDAIGEGKSLRSICADPRMPTARNFLRWVARRPFVQKRYREALELRGEHHAEAIIDIADELPPRRVAMGVAFLAPEDVKAWIARQRLRIDARKWTAARLLPKKYGDKLALTDGDGKPLVPPNIGITFEDGGPGAAAPDDGVETSS